MSQPCTFASLRLSIPSGWLDVTEDLPEGAPPTLAKADGVGALQFSVAKHQAGSNPNITLTDLETMLGEFADKHSLGIPLDVERVTSASQLVGGSFRGSGELIRAWYSSDGANVALVTYVTAVPLPDAEAELADAGFIVRSINFGSPDNV